MKFAFRPIQKIIPSSLSILSHRLVDNTGENHVITCLSLKWLPLEAGVGRDRFRVTEMIKWGQKSKPQKISEPKTNPKKIPGRISEPLNFPQSIKWYNTKLVTWLEVEWRLCLRLGYAGTTTSLQIVLNTPQNPT